MAIKCLIAEQQTNQFYFKYTLDDTKLALDGTPAPEYIREWSYAPQPPEGMSEADYIAMMKRELPLLAQSELDAMQTPAPAPTTLSGF